ncbi:MAG: hypothetical protein GF364_06770 [Candidatus Lokiarchaeota archaeon]|nr:hypothetical protein [Candidatus Lokiarchaeota archaeon]
MTSYIAKYKFIRDDVYLCAYVNQKTGRQKLVMEKINPRTGTIEFTDAISCIHTAVTSIKACDVDEDQPLDKDLEEKILYIRSTEHLREIHLEPSEKFKAFKSWVAGIAEAGVDAFKLQEEIEEAGHLLTPIAVPLMKFMIRVDTDFIYMYLNEIEKKSYYEGQKSESYLIANLIPVLNLALDYYQKNDTSIIDAIFELDPPLKLFSRNHKFMKFLSYPKAVEMSEFRLAFYSGNKNVRACIALNPRAVVFEEFAKFFDPKQEKNDIVKLNAFKNPNARELEEYNKALDAIQTSNVKLYLKALRNIIAAKGGDLKDVFLGLGLPEQEAAALAKIENHKHTQAELIREQIQHPSEMLKKTRKEMFYFSMAEGHVTSITMRNMNLYLLPDEIINFTHLQKLDASHNKLGFVANKFDQLTDLRVLDLSHNRFDYIDPEVGRLNSLEVLNFHKNLIEKIPKSFLSLTTLRDLDLSYNKLNSLPQDLHKLVSLEKIDLRENMIHKYPLTLLKFERLQFSILDLNVIKNSEVLGFLATSIDRFTEILENVIEGNEFSQFVNKNASLLRNNYSKNQNFPIIFLTYLMTIINNERKEPQEPSEDTEELTIKLIKLIKTYIKSDACSDYLLIAIPEIDKILWLYENDEIGQFDILVKFLMIFSESYLNITKYTFRV